MSRALIFDCDGVLGDTERNGHLRAFNQMWEEFGVPWRWSAADYAAKLKIGGGKERLASLFSDTRFLDAVKIPPGAADRHELVARWHQRKSEIFRSIVNGGGIPARPGVRRLAQEALDRGWKLAVASTSARESVESMLRHTMGASLAARFSAVLGGEFVNHKKPAPDVYLLAARRLGAAPRDCIAIEDSPNGLTAAAAAGMPCVVTLCDPGPDDDFSSAAIVLSCLGDPGGEAATVVANRSRARPGLFLTARDLENIAPSVS